MRGAIRLWGLGASLVAGAALADAARHPLSLADDATFGPDRYLANTAVVAFAPAPAWSVALNAGVTSTTTPTEQTTRSLGVDARVDAGSAVTLALGYTAYTGDLSAVYAYTPATETVVALDTVGTVDDPQQFQTLAGSVTARIVDPGPDAEPESWRPTVRLQLGASVQTQGLPLWQAGFKGEWKKFGQYQNVDNAYLSGLTATVRRTEVGFAYTRHHYTGAMNLGANATAAQQAIGLSVLRDLRTSTGSPIAGVANADALLTLTQPLGWKLTLFAAYQYSALQATPDAPDAENLARTTEATLAWGPADWIEARAGVSWLLQAGAVSTYVKAGLSVFY